MSCRWSHRDVAWFYALPSRGKEKTVRLTDPKKYPRRKDKGRWLCRWCSNPCPKGRSSFCSEACKDEVWIRTSASYARDCVWLRDKGTCAYCGAKTQLLEDVLHDFWGSPGWPYPPSRVPTWQSRPATGSFKGAATTPRARHFWCRVGEAIGEQLRRAGFTRNHLWEMDHIKPVACGGGGCGLDNLQTLCVPCHKQKTRQQLREKP